MAVTFSLFSGCVFALVQLHGDILPSPAYFRVGVVAAVIKKVKYYVYLLN